jgi:hypothetical protein
VSLTSLKQPQNRTRTNLNQSIAQQSIDEQQVISGSTVIGDSGVISSSEAEDLSSLLQAFLQDNSEIRQYEGVTDSYSYRNLGSFPDRDMVRSLRNRNRFRALEQQEQIQVLKLRFREALAQVNYSADYLRDDEPEFTAFMIEQFGPEADNQKITASQYAVLKDIQQRNAESGGARVVTSHTANNRTSRLNTSILGGGIRDVNVDSIDSRWAVHGTDIFEDNIANVPSNGIPIGATLAMGYEHVLEAESVNRTVVSTLANVDQENSYIESLFGLNNLNIDMAGRPESFSVAEIWENCWDCFAGFWNGETDFALNLDIELRLDELINVLNDILKALAYSFDIPAIVLKNLCALFRLGFLCPIEIAFIIASLVAMIRFMISEVILDFKGFLFALLSAILLPLMNILDLGVNLAINPFNYQLGCVMTNLLSAQQVGWTGAFTRRQINEVFQGINGDDSEIIPQGSRLDLVNRLNNIQSPGFLRKLIIRDPSEELPRPRRPRLDSFRQNRERPRRPRDPDRLENRVVDESITGLENTIRNIVNGTTGQIDVLDWIKETTLMDITDPLELIKSLLLESNSKLGNIARTIKAGLEGLKAWLIEHSIARIELIARITVTSTIIGVLISLFKALMGNQDMCRSSIDPETGREVIEVSMGPAEFYRTLDLPPYLQIQETNIPTVSIDGESAGDNRSQSNFIIRNSITENIYTVVSCQKGNLTGLTDAQIQAALSSLGAI